MRSKIFFGLLCYVLVSTVSLFAAQDVIITEFMAANTRTLADEDGDFEDWIEIYNAGTITADLDGWFLKDGTSTWRFPQTNLAPNAFLVVFASNKDRHVSGQPLHTNFRLERNGEYLALVKPDGVTVASAYAPSYPIQVSDISYGLPVIQTPVTLVSNGAPARLLVPLDDSLGTAWTLPEFNDSAWTAVSNGIGYEADATAAFTPVIVADSVTDFRGVQGSNNWFYGYWDKTSDTNGVYDPATDFVPFPRGAGNTLSSTNYWDGSKWDWAGPTNLPPFIELTSSGGRPSGNNGNPLQTNHWAVRRWVAETNGPLRITGTLACNSQSGACGDGTIGRILVDGVEVFQRAVFGSSVGYSIVVQANIGSLIDFVIDAGANNNDSCDGTTFTATVRTAGGAAVVADTIADWAQSGTQGEKNWSYGYFNKTTGGTYAANKFTPFPSGTGPHSAGNFWNGEGWQWFDGDPPFDTIGEIETRPSIFTTGGVNANEHWVIRRWVSEVSGTIHVDWHIAKKDLTGGGVTATVYQNGTQKDTFALTGNDFVGTNRTITITGVQVGDFIDFAVAPGPDVIGDICFLNATIHGSGSLSGQFAFDVGDRMTNINATAYLRIPFNLADVSGINGLTLRMKHDDGFVAYLNGTLVASANAPGTPSWNSSATGIRPDTDVSQFEDFNLDGVKDFLVSGANVLAIHGLNASPTDSDFLIVAELLATRPSIDTSGKRYFASPTPGSFNGTGTTNLGPLITDVNHTPAEPLDTEDLLVTATVSPTLNPVTNVSLYYRVMYGAEVSVPMLDDGLHGDGPAGDGVYGAFIPNTAHTNGQMVRYYFISRDSANNQSRQPPLGDTNNSSLYFGTVVKNPSLTNELRVLHWFTQNPITSTTFQRASVYWLGEFYDNIKMNTHGQSSGGFPNHSYNMDFNPDHHFKPDTDLPRVDDINLLSSYADKAHMRLLLSYQIYADSGPHAPYHFSVPARMQSNGVFHSIMHITENGDDKYLKRLDRDPNGALYKMYTDPSQEANAEKKTRRFEDKSDFRALVSGINSATNRTYIYDNVDVSEVINFFAAMIVTASVDCCHKNFYLYRDSEGDGEWEMLPWDLDLSFGRNWQSGETYWDDRVYPNNGLFVGGTFPLGPNFIFANAVTRAAYLRRVRTLQDELLQTNGTPAAQLNFEKQIDHWEALMKNDAALDLAKWGTWGGGNGGAGGGGTRIDSPTSPYYRPLPQAVQELKTNYLVNRRAFVFNQKMGSAAEFPDAQPTNAVILFGALDYNPATHNQAEEFVQLINTNAFSVDISGWTLSGSIEHTFQGGVVIPRAGLSNTLYVVPDKKAFRNRATAPKGGQGLYVEGPYKGQLSARGETITLKDKLGRVVMTNAYVGAPSGAQQYLRITELMYHPPDPGAGSPYLQEEFEFIELKNIGPVAINLAGVHFTNGIDFVFSSANRTNLNAGERLILAKNVPAFTFRYPGVTNVTGPYLGSLDNNGETIRLDDAVGEKILEFAYNNSWYRMTDGNGFSLVVVNENAPYNTWGDQASWRYSTAYNGSPGAADAAPMVFPTILVNEVFAHSVPLDVDAVELYNPTASAVDVGNWWISDDFLTPRKYRIPASTMIPAGGYRVFTESDFNNPPGGPNSFAFSSAGDEAYIFSGDATGNITGYFEGFDFDASEPGVSIGRYFTSETNLHYVAQKVLSLGAANAGPKVGPIIISEIMYHPPDIAAIDNNADEFIELQNISTNAVPLFDPAYPTNRWRLDDAVQFTFSTNTIPAGGFLVVVSFNPTNTAMLDAFRATYRISSDVVIVGPYSGQLDNSDESVELKKPDTSVLTNITTVLVERVHYHDAAPWDSFADGFAASLQRIVAADYGNDPTNWVAAFPNPGAPFAGGTRPVITVQPTNAAVLARNGTNTFTVVATGPGLQYQWRANGTNLPGATNSTLLLVNVETTQAGDYQVIVFNGAGGVFSSNAHLGVVLPVAFTVQPQNVLPAPGSTVTLTSLAVGTGTIRYQWRFEGANIANATNASYTFTNASIPTHHGNFSVVAMDDLSTAVSSNALVFIRILPGIAVQPVPVTNLQWQTATFTVIATGAPPLNYRWLRNGVNFLSNAPPTLVITNLQLSMAGSFRVTVTNLAGSANSMTVGLGVIPDTDADGLPDFWETNYVGNATNMSATADPDGDGMSNRDEYVAGTNPTNALSVLKLTLTTTNTAVLQFVAQTNIGYTLQYRTNLNTASWNNLTSIAAQSLMQTVQVNVPKPPPEAARYYRVVTPIVP